jgi:hypothetical protein
MIEQRYVLRLFAGDGELGAKIHRCLKHHHGDDAISRSKVYTPIVTSRAEDLISKRLRAQGGPSKDFPR